MRRRESLRRAGALYQRSRKGARRHARRQHHWRGKNSAQKVTHHGFSSTPLDVIVTTSAPAAQTRADTEDRDGPVVDDAADRDEDLKLLVTSPEGDDLIKARLPLRPPHPRALLDAARGDRALQRRAALRCDFCGRATATPGSAPSSGARTCGPPRVRSFDSTSRSPRRARAAASAASVTSATCGDSFGWSGLDDEAARLLRPRRRGAASRPRRGRRGARDRQAPPHGAQDRPQDPRPASRAPKAGGRAARLHPRPVRARDPRRPRRHARDARARRARAAAAARVHRRRHHPARSPAASASPRTSRRRS